jgi:hypothetical protein
MNEDVGTMQHRAWVILVDAIDDFLPLVAAYTVRYRNPIKAWMRADETRCYHRSVFVGMALERLPSQTS